MTAYGSQQDLASPLSSRQEPLTLMLIVNLYYALYLSYSISKLKTLSEAMALYFSILRSYAL